MQIVRIFAMIVILCFIFQTDFAQDVNAKMVIQSGHNSSNGSMNAAVFSPDSKYMLSYDATGIYILWEIATGREIQRFVSGKIPSTGVDENGLHKLIAQPSVAADNKYVLIEGVDCFKLWNTYNGTVIHSFGNNDKEGTCMQAYFSVEGKKVIYLALGRDLKYRLSIYTIDKNIIESFPFLLIRRTGVTNTYSEALKNLFWFPSFLSLSENGKSIAFGMQDGRVILCDFYSMAKKAESAQVTTEDMDNFFVDTTLIHKVVFIDNDKNLIAHSDNAVYIFDVKKKKLINAIRLPTHKTSAFKSKTGDPAEGFVEIDVRSEGAIVSENGKLLGIYYRADYAKSGNMKIYSVPGNKYLYELGPLNCTERNGLEVGSRRCPFMISKISNNGEHYLEKWHADYTLNPNLVITQMFVPKSIILENAGFNSNIKGAYFGMVNNDAFIFNGNTGKINRLRDWIEQKDTLFGGKVDYLNKQVYNNKFQVSEDEKLAISTGQNPQADNYICIWNWEKQKLIKKVISSSPWNEVHAISRNNQFALTEQLLDVNKGKLLGDYQVGRFNCQFSKDGKNLYRLIRKEANNEMHLFVEILELPSLKVIKTLALKSTKTYPPRLIGGSNLAAFVQATSLSKDGRILLTSIDNDLVCWDIHTGEELYRLNADIIFAGISDSFKSVEFSHDDRLIAASLQFNKSIYIIDYKAKTIFHKLEGHIEPAYSLSFSKDNLRLVSVSSDRTARIWNVTTGKELALFTAYSINDYILRTPDGYYMASKKGAQALHFVKDLNAYSFQQFDLQLNRPDIVLDRIGFSSRGTIDFYKRAYDKRLKTMGFDPASFERERSFNVPQLHIINPPATAVKITDRSLKISVSAEDKVYELNRINLLVNGVQVYGSKGFDLKKSHSKKIDLPFFIELSSGKNIIEISVVNEKGVESISETLEVDYVVPSAKPNLYIIAIGAGKYKNEIMNLNYPSKDAQDVISTFSSSSLYNKVIPYYISDERVKSTSILALKKELFKNRVDDQVIIFYSGHGLFNAKLDYFLATWDLNFTAPENGGLLLEDLENLLDSIPSRNKILLIDACHSGEIDKETIALSQSKPLEAGSVIWTKAGNQDVEQKQIGLENSFEMMKQLFTDLRKSTGATVISAAGGGQAAIEGAQWKNGVFTYSLLSGLKSKSADTNKDGKIMLSELMAYVQKNVSELTNGKQVPTSRIENIVNDFQIW